MGGQIGQTHVARAGQIQAQADRAAAQQSRSFLESKWDEFRQYLEGQAATAGQRFQISSDAAKARERQEASFAEQRAVQRQLQLANDPRYQMANAYLTESFAAGVPEFMAREYEGRLRTAQAARGLSRGGAPTQQEAALLTKMSSEARQNLLPQLMGAAEADAQRPAQYRQQELALAAAAQQMGQSQLATGTQAYATQKQAELAQSAQLASLFGGTMGLANFSNAAPGAYSILAGLNQNLSVPDSGAGYGGFVPPRHFSFVM